MATECKGVLLRDDTFNGIAMLSPLQRGVLLSHLIADSGFDGLGEIPEMDAMTSLAFQLISPSVKRAQDSTSRRSEVNTENGKKGGRPRKTEQKPKNPSVSAENQSVIFGFNPENQTVPQAKRSETNPNETKRNEANTQDVGVCGSSPIRTGMPSKGRPDYKGFCSVWQVYPLKQGEDDAWRVYAQLNDDGILPEPYALRDAVVLMAENDDRWQRGMIPTMANWLQGHRWKDQPLHVKTEDELYQEKKARYAELERQQKEQARQQKPAQAPAPRRLSPEEEAEDRRKIAAAKAMREELAARGVLDPRYGEVAD